MGDDRRGGGCVVLGHSTLNMEAQAVLLSLLWLRSRQYTHVRIYTDASAIITHLQQNNNPLVNMKWIFQDIKNVAASFEWCIIVKVHRRMVQSAHDLANYCRRTPFSFSTS